MAVLAVNPNRMQLQRLKKRLKTAVRGHKLLKDKQDELVRIYIERVGECRRLRRKVTKMLEEAYKAFLFARASIPREFLDEALEGSTPPPRLQAKVKPVMNLRVPQLRVEGEAGSVDYGFAGTTAELDRAVELFRELIPALLELASVENEVHMIAEELEKTRRRVNALEYRLIPDFQDTIRMITMKLSEMERSNLSRLLRLFKQK